MPNTQTDLIPTSPSVKAIPVTIGEGASINAPLTHEALWEGITVRGSSAYAVNRFLFQLKKDFSADALSKLIGIPNFNQQLQVVAENAQINAETTVIQTTRGLVIELTPDEIPLEQLRFWQLPAANPDFVGRTEPLKTLASQLQQCQQSPDWPKHQWAWWGW